MKIQIYSPTLREAGELAGKMNLHIRQWHWDGPHHTYPNMTWAYLEPLFDRLNELEFRLAELDK